MTNPNTNTPAFDLETFTFNGITLHTVVIDGEPWFSAKDMLRAIGSKARNTQHVRDVADEGDYRIIRVQEVQERGIELRYLFPTGARGSANSVSLVNEPGLYKFTLRAQRSNPAARDFQDWITKTVIPAIRKTGGYVKDGVPAGADRRRSPRGRSRRLRPRRTVTTSPFAEIFFLKTTN